MRPSPATFMTVGIAVLSTVLLADLQPIHAQTAESAQSAATAPPIAPAAIEQAVKDLGHDDFAVRERATEYLIRAGEAAVPAVQAAVKSTDPEVALRARIVLKRVASGLPPGTSPELATLIDEFQAADRNKKLNLIFKIERPEEIRVLTETIAKEKDASQRQTLDSFLRSRISSLAAQHFRTNRIDDAAAVLRSREGDTAAEAMLLTLQLVTGRLPQRAEQLTAALAARPDPAQQRRLALVHRAAGDLAQARAAAERLETRDLALWLAIEAADSPAALRINRQRSAGQEPTIEQLALTLALAHYAQDANEFQAAKEEITKRAADRPADLWPAAEALLVAEQFDEAIELLKRGVPAAAFYLLWYRHDFDAAFALAGAAPGTTFDAAWYARLPEGNLVPTSLSLRRSDYAGDIAAVLHYVGRKDEARQVLDVLREAVRREPATSLAWYDLVEADLRMGLRERALEDAAVPLSRPADMPREPPEVAVNYVFSTNVLNELYGREFVQRHSSVWSLALAACDDDARAALPLVEPLFHLPAARKLSPEERRARLDALLALPTGRDAYRHGQFLQQVASLAARLGEEDVAYRYRARGTTMARSGTTFVYLQRGLDAASDRDWPTAAQHLRRYERASSSSSQQQEQLGIALLKLGQSEEGRKLLEQALKWRIEPGAYLMQAQLLLSQDLESEAAERFRTATRLMPPGEVLTINAFNSLGNALNVAAPAEAVTLWKINMLGPLLAGSDMTLDLYLKNAAVIRRESARAAIQAGEFQEAADHALAELAAMPGDVVGVEQLVPLLDENGQAELADEVFARSVASYARVCEKFPQAAAHRNLLARTSARCNRRLDEALALAKEAIALDAENANYLATLAEVHLARGDKTAAIAAAEAGLALEPKHPVCERVLAKAKN
jgi:hypothetical protein